MSNHPMLNAEELSQIPDDGIIIDVRTDMEHAEKHLARGHIHVPLDTLDPDSFMKSHGLDKTRPVYILCRSGKRAQTAAEKFCAAGYDNTYVIEGGIIACEACGHDVKGHNAADAAQTDTKKKTGLIPLERQVRIAAGLFSAVGAVLALTLNPLFSLIPLAVGAGLVYAGITDHCGLALVLTKAPWNKPATQ